jgi:simple sugar transport system substrate-binding protein
LAAEQVGATMTFRNPPTGDLADMVRIIEQTTAEKPDGIILTIPDMENCRRRNFRRDGQGNSSRNDETLETAEQSKELGALLHVGQPEFRRWQRRW